MKKLTAVALMFFGLSFAIGEDSLIEELRKKEGNALSSDTAKSVRARAEEARKALSRYPKGQNAEIAKEASLAQYQISNKQHSEKLKGNLYEEASVGTVLIYNSRGGHGTGSLISKDGLILTNQHVVKFDSKVTVYFKPSNDEELEAIVGKVVKVRIKNDLALVKVSRVPSNAKIISISGSTPSISNDAHAIGNPGGGEYWTYSRGHISAITKGYTWDYGDGAKRKADVLQTTTAINPGNSGGPLLNNNGELIGVNSIGIANTQGISYAVMTTTVQEFLDIDSDELNLENKRIRSKMKVESASTQCGVDADGWPNIVGTGTGSNDYFGEFVRLDYDPECTGRVTMSFVMPHIKSKPVAWILWGPNENARAMVLDFEKDGAWDETFVDTDDDGKFDRKGVNEEGELFATNLVLI